MSAEILDGKKIAEQVRAEIRQRVADIQKTTGESVSIVNILIGHDVGAQKYAEAQRRAAADVGIMYALKTFDPEITQKDLQYFLKELCRDSSVTGVMIHRPLPKQLNEQELFNHIDHLKDIEGMNARNIGNIVTGQGHIVPCTAAAVMEHLRAAGVALRGKEVVIVGASKNVGRPLALLFLQEMATVTVCHIATAEAGKLADHVRRADIVIVAVGKPNLITGDMINDGAVVIDVGMNQVNGKIVGDVDFCSVSKKAFMITPVPGGVGPLTVVMLMRNAIEAFHLQKNHP